MGSAAVPLLIASTAVSTTASVVQGNRNAQAIEQQREAQVEQTRNQAKEEQIKRLQQQRLLHEQNVISAMGSGFTLEGSPATLLDANRTLAEEDLTIIQGNASRAVNQINQSAKSAQNANAFNTGMKVVGGFTTAAVGYQNATAGSKGAEAGKEAITGTGLL